MSLSYNLIDLFCSEAEEEASGIEQEEASDVEDEEEEMDVEEPKESEVCPEGEWESYDKQMSLKDCQN